VLVVDDIPNNRRLLNDILAPAGFQVLEAINGADALAVFNERLPDVVLMDMRMPVMDGYEATRRIKATTAGARTPVIAITAHALQDNRQAIFDCGVDAYLSKPIDPSLLFLKLQELLDLQYDTTPDDSMAMPYSSPQLHSKTLRTLIPENVRLSMCQALEQGDMAQFNSDLEQLRVQHPSIARTLQHLANDFEYDTLQHLLNGPSHS